MEALNILPPDIFIWKTQSKFFPPRSADIGVKFDFVRLIVDP